MSAIDLALLTRKFNAAQDRIEELECALKDIVNPVAAMQREAKAKGHRLDGMMCVKLADDPNYLKEIAREALGKGLKGLEGPKEA